MERLPPLSLQQRSWRFKVLISTWTSYVGFYFCRKNYVIAKSSIQESLQISEIKLAHIYTAFLVAYMLGQFLTGVLGRRLATRLILLWSMAATLFCNVIFGITFLAGPSGYFPLMVFMIISGLAQATGWPGNLGVLSNWLRRQERGKILALWSTNYQLGSIFAKMFAAFMLGALGAVWSFWGASTIMLGIWALFYFLERDRPEDLGLDSIVPETSPEAPTAVGEPSNPKEKKSSLGWSSEVIWTILFMGALYFVFKFLRYALDSWSPMAVEKMFALSKENAGYISSLFDGVGFIGVLFAGWASDYFFKGRRYQIIALMSTGMLLCFIFLGWVGGRSVWLFSIGLSLCGFMLMGPDSLLSGAGAVDVAGKKGAILAVGIISGLGSIGPIFQEEIMGFLIRNYGYQDSLRFLVIVCALGMIGALGLGFRSRRKHLNL